MLVPTKYKASCDVPECEKEAEGSLNQLAQLNWSRRLLTGGKPEIVSILNLHVPNGAPVICPSCTVTGKWKDL